MRIWHGRRNTPRPLNCLQVRRVLQAYLDGTVDETTVRRVTAHLDGCRRCGLEAETYRAIKDALARDETTSAVAVARLRAFGENLLAADPPPP